MLVRAEQLELPVGSAGEEESLKALPRRNAVMVTAAVRRLRAAAVHREERAKLTLEQVGDRRTSLADARIALCVAQGTALDDIDPVSGYSLSRESYERVRQSWRNQARQPGWSECYRRDLEEAIAYWAERRPEFTEGDDWLAGLLKPEEEM